MIGTGELRRIPRLGPVGCVRSISAAVLAAGLQCALPASAHHSEAGFDIESVIAFEGTVTQVAWRNPHVYVGVAVTSDAGAAAEWEVETGAVPLLIRSGWTQESLQPGDRVFVRGHPAREPGRRYALLLSLEKADGTVLRQQVTDAPSTGVARDLSGIWKGNLASLEFLAQGFESMPLTPQGSAARAVFDANVDHPAARCIPYPSPSIILASGLFLTGIELGADAVRIRNEWFDVERTVHMNSREHPANGERTNQGHSIGRWEGETLVVDTALFADHRSPYQTGVPSGAQKHVVERYTLAPDGSRLIVEFVLEDPEFLAEPFSGRVEWSYRPDLDFYEFNCDPSVSGHYVPE
jgi:hypothetical protein